MTEPVGIDEAIYDYMEAYNQYMRNLRFYQTDMTVFEANLSTYLDIPIRDIRVYKREIVLFNVELTNELIEKIQEITEEVHTHLLETCKILILVIPPSGGK